METTSKNVRQKLDYSLCQIKRPAQGVLRHDYLVPGGPYNEQWDWDAFFMGVALLAEDASEAIYLKNWTLNYLDNAAEDGKVPGCITPQGADRRLNHMKPFLAQGAYLAGKTLNDFSWLAAQWDTFVSVLTYRKRSLWNEKYNLAVWHDSMESGADNNVAALDFPDKSVIGTDLNAFLFREYMAASFLAKKLDYKAEGKLFEEEATQIKKGMERLLWNEENQIFYNLFVNSGEHIKRVSYSCFVPLWAGLAPSVQAGKNCIERYLLSEEHMKSPYGLRTLSKSDEEYNNVNMIKPHSNWQGPVWPIANYIYMHALLNYRFKDQACELAESTCRLVLRDIENTGGMHENYDAETGEPLAAPNFVSWNILVRNMLDESSSGENPFFI